MSHSKPIALAAALLLAVGCGPAASETTEARAPEGEPTPIALPAPPDAGAIDTDEVVARALDVVSKLRELPAKGPVKGKTIGRTEMVAHVQRQIRTEIPDDVVRAQTELLFGLGVVDGRFDYEASVLSLLTSQLAGFYEPKDKTMYLAADLRGLERGATLSHELVHALQDQHYDLGQHVKFREDASDEQSATHALAEGDATSAMIDQMLAARGLRAVDVSDELISLEARGAVEMDASAADVPTIIKRSLVAPYVDGVLFVHWLRRRGGWAEVDKVWRKLPKSTEQILHPEKLIAGEGPEAVAVPSAPPKGPSKQLYRDVWGEQSLRLLFEEWMPRRTAISAAADWAGDRVVVYRDGDRHAIAWHLRFDHETAAQRALGGFARGVLRAEHLFEPTVAAAEAEAAAKSGSLCRERAQRGPFAALRKGRSVVIIAGMFRRTAGSGKSDAKCADAVAWATAIAGGK